MSTGFEPSAEMVEAGARALAHAEGYEDWDALAMHAQFTYREKARAVLVAGCTATVTEPCPTCGPDGDYAVDHLDATHRCPAPVCAWLSPFLNAGMLREASRADAVDYADWISGSATLFRVLPPATPGEGE